MNTATIDSSATEIKGRVSQLREEFETLRQTMQAAEVRGREIDREIRELQRQCPHDHTTEVPVMDVAEMKIRNVCTDCGAER